MQVICKNCGTVDDYRTEVKANNHCAFCNSCGAFIKNIPVSKPKMHFGKYAGEYIENITDRQYLQWAFNNLERLNVRTRDAIQKQLNSL
jgi:hypothetical protein